MALVAFDLNGTLLSPDALADPLGGADADRALVHAALDDAIAQGMATTLAGAFTGFAALIEGGLRHRLRLAGRDEELAAAAMRRVTAMEPSPGAREALATLRGAGHEACVLTNSAGATAEEALRACGLREELAFVLGTDAVGAAKPDPRVYGALLERAGRPAGEVWLVAAHWWDVLGAARAGLRTGWVGARERDLLAPLGEPDVRGTDLAEVAAAIVAATEGEARR